MNIDSLPVIPYVIDWPGTITFIKDLAVAADMLFAICTRGRWLAARAR